MRPSLRRAATHRAGTHCPGLPATGRRMRGLCPAHAAGLPVLLKGPTGCGKTRLIEHMAARLGRPLITVSGHDDLGAADLTGRHLIEGGDTVWVDGPLTAAMRLGRDLLSGRSGRGAQGHHRGAAPAGRRPPRAAPGTHRRAISPPRPASSLCWPTTRGYQHLLKGLKPSTRQRFVGLTLGYPTPELEARIVVAESGCSADTATRLVRLAQALRRLTDHDLEETALDAAAGDGGAAASGRAGVAAGRAGGGGRGAVG